MRTIVLQVLLCTIAFWTLCTIVLQTIASESIDVKCAYVAENKYASMVSTQLRVIPLIYLFQNIASRYKTARDTGFLLSFYPLAFNSTTLNVWHLLSMTSFSLYRFPT